MNEASAIVYTSSGYARALKRIGIEDVNLFAPGKRAVLLLLRRAELSLIVGDPKIRNNYCRTEDDGRVLRIASGFKFFAVRDHHPGNYAEDIGGGSTVTFLLPDEY
ncbi:MAG: hypothetical protein A2234_04960 [Elusimicrobia bacterium RIFOXYA2_FULL_58_8]|nr:MAG: hypothetical protein A2234_04960 [Elusimicrobia bacterium RIFOXYA2_FULL_58_8]OGS14222.1 MAG: hypothetical protein A2285_05610 [Elusimicrobia bacterium RIFOXYA12_FULL_57_11]